MSFAPLVWLWNTLTFWHLAVWLVLSIVPSFVFLRHEPFQKRLFFLQTALWMWVFWYGMMALACGQTFGDSYPLSVHFPTGFLLGAGFGSLLAFPISKDEKVKPRPLFGVVMAKAAVMSFTGAFFGFATWLIPHMNKLLFDWPQYSWAVQL